MLKIPGIPEYFGDSALTIWDKRKISCISIDKPVVRRCHRDPLSMRVLSALTVAFRVEIAGNWGLIKLVPRCFEWVAEATVVNKASLAKMETQDEER